MSETANEIDSGASMVPGLPYETAEEWQEMLQNFGANGRTMRDFTNVSKDSMEVFYMVAFNQYNAGQFEDASKVFQLLCTLDHFEKRFWMGLGSSRAMEGKHEDALKAYGYMAFLDFKDPVPVFHCAKSFMALGKIPEAESGFRAAAANSAGKPEHADIKQQSEALLELLHTQQKEIIASQAS